MNRNEQLKIPIYPSVVLLTSKIMEQELKLENPLALKTAQNLLVSCEKILYKKGGFFGSENKCKKKVEEIFKQLIGQLRMDMIFSQQHPNTADLLLTYLSKVTIAYPNCQVVYLFLNEMVPHLYNIEQSILK